tara:strand:- start:341 stop:952 length:612 start_codon:yes stop_codon:yes gene_type:complete
MDAAIVYNLLRGPVAAEAIEAVTDPSFAECLADAMGLTNADTLPPAALMAEWAVRCVYTDGFHGTMWTQAKHDHSVYELVDACLGGVRDPSTVARFVHAADTFVTQGRRVRPGLWPDVYVRHAPCTQDDQDMSAALLVNQEDAEKGCENTRDQQNRRGRALVAQARFVLSVGTARRNTINHSACIKPNSSKTCPNSTLANTEI